MPEGSTGCPTRTSTARPIPPMPGASAIRGVRFGLAARIFVASALLVVAVLGATFGVTALRANRTAGESIPGALANTRRAVTDLLSAHTRALAGLSQVCARLRR